MYAAGEYDLAGFAVGIAERDALLRPDRVVASDVIIGVASSGLHSNGYSLARRVFIDEMELNYDQPFADGQASLGDALLEPTRIYTKSITHLLEQLGGEVHGLAHITGGGLLENIPRALPKGLTACIDRSTYERPAIFRALAEGGPVEEQEMQRTFNLGVGLVAIVQKDHAEKAVAALNEAGENAWVLGQVSNDREPAIIID